MTFMKQMNGMVAELNSTRCNFIRCIKPNYQLTPDLFDAKYTNLSEVHQEMLALKAQNFSNIFMD